MEGCANTVIGLNFNCVEGVISTCTDENNPPKYEPISCGDCKYPIHIIPIFFIIS